MQELHQKGQFNSSLNPFSKEIQKGISVINALKNRGEMLEKSLPTWLSNDHIDEIIIVDWSSNEDLLPLIRSFNSDKIILAVVKDQPKWILSIAFNLAARLTSRTELLKLDADIKLLDGFFDTHQLTPRNFFTGNWQKARNDNERHLHGTCFIYRDDFFKVNGYNEFIKSYGWDDIDLYDRLVAINLIQNDISNDTLHHIEHTGRTSFQNHMQFLKTDQDYDKALLNALINRFLCEITRHWITDNKMLSFKIIPESKNLIYCVQEHEDFNIASPEMIQQCERKAMVQRLKELGVLVPNDFLNNICHGELVDFINFYYEKEGSASLMRYFNLLNKMNTRYYKALEQLYALNREKKNWSGQMNEKQAIIDRQEKELEKSQVEIQRKELELQSLKRNLASLKNSYSVKIGRAFTSAGRLFSSMIPGISKSLLSADKNSIPVQLPRKLNLGSELTADYGQHRSGWSFAISSLSPLHNPNGVILDAFIERTFVWHPGGIKPHLEPWVGFIHIPPIVPDWFGSKASNESVFSTAAWKESFPYCKGLYTLSAYHKDYLVSRLNIPINNLLHPTEEPLVKWDWKRFRKNREKKVVQIGYWLRKLLAIYALEAPDEFQKCFIRKENVNLDNIFKKEQENSEYKYLMNEKTLGSVKTINFMSNLEYDQLLSENIVFLDLYDSSANNSVIECIVRNTPILINPLEPVIEYLGKDYPFYFNNLQEASEKLRDMDLIRQTHFYLCDNPLKKKLTDSYFLDSLINSQIYSGL